MLNTHTNAPVHTSFNRPQVPPPSTTLAAILLPPWMTLCHATGDHVRCQTII